MHAGVWCLSHQPSGTTRAAKIGRGDRLHVSTQTPARWHPRKAAKAALKLAPTDADLGHAPAPARGAAGGQQCRTQGARKRLQEPRSSEHPPSASTHLHNIPGRGIATVPVFVPLPTSDGPPSSGPGAWGVCWEMRLQRSSWQHCQKQPHAHLSLLPLPAWAEHAIKRLTFARLLKLSRQIVI